MATLKELNLRLASLASTKKITQAMKLISTTKLNKFQAKIKNAKNYYNILKSLFDSVMEEARENSKDFMDNRLFYPKIVNKTKILLFTSDRGLCGSFNSNIIKGVQRLIDEKKKLGREVNLDYYGNRGQTFFSKRKYFSEHHYQALFTAEYSEETAIELAENYISGLLSENYDELYFVYNDYISIISQRLLIKKILPFDFMKNFIETNENGLNTSEKKKTQEENSSRSNSYTLEPNLSQLVEDLLKKFLSFEIYIAYLNSTTGEHAARMTSMDSATNNCMDMIDDITLLRNRVRQAAITKELIEIISGAESI